MKLINLTIIFLPLIACGGRVGAASGGDAPGNCAATSEECATINNVHVLEHGIDQQLVEFCDGSAVAALDADLNVTSMWRCVVHGSCGDYRGQLSLTLDVMSTGAAGAGQVAGDNFKKDFCRGSSGQATITSTECEDSGTTICR